MCHTSYLLPDWQLLMATTSKRSLVSRAKAALTRNSAEPVERATTSPAKKTVTKKAPAVKKTVTKKAPAATKTVTKKAPEGKKTVTKKAPATKAPAKKAPAKPAAAKKAAVKTVAANRDSGAQNGTAKEGTRLVVLEQEEPWSKQELAEVRSTLKADIKRLTAELALGEEELAEMISSSDGAGQDTADIGSASFERDQEMTIVANARIMLEQSEHALERIADKTYGVCENCGNPIGKNRLMAFPRATMCLSCKRREERR